MTKEKTEIKDGQKVFYQIREGVLVEMLVVSQRSPYGRELFKITPIAGSGEFEVERETLVVPEND